MAELKRCTNNDCKTTWALGDNCPKCGLGFRPAPSDNESVEKNNSFWDACVFYFASALMVISIGIVAFFLVLNSILQGLGDPFNEAIDFFDRQLNPFFW